MWCLLSKILLILPVLWMKELRHRVDLSGMGRAEIPTQAIWLEFASRPKKCPGRKTGNASSVALGWGSLLHQWQPRNPEKSMPPQAPTLWPHQRHSSADTTT